MSAEHGEHRDNGALPPELAGTADTLERGLRAESAPAGFTEGVIRRIQLARERPAPARPAPVHAAPPRPLGRRSALVAALVTWAAAFAVGLVASDPPPSRVPGATIARRVGADPRAGWVRIETLANLGRAGLVDGALAGGLKQGYRFEAFWDGEDPRRWWIIASPATPGRSGERYFFVDESGVIRFATDGAPTANSPAIGG